MLKCESLTKKYGSKLAVYNLTLNIEKGKVYALLGSNGSGKTTLMKMIAGLTHPTSGTILYENQPIGIATKKEIAYMPTDSFFYKYMSIKDVGKYYKDFFQDFDEEKYKELLERMELSEKLKASSLSTGLGAKLKLCATLARKAKLYMLDEPLNGIDIIAREQVMNTILEAMNEENSFIISSHLVDELETVIDEAIFIKNGVLELNRSAEELRAQYNNSISEIYKMIYLGKGEF